jgi:hypothetical protein
VKPKKRVLERDYDLKMHAQVAQSVFVYWQKRVSREDLANLQNKMAGVQNDYDIEVRRLTESFFDFIASRDEDSVGLGLGVDIDLDDSSSSLQDSKDSKDSQHSQEASKGSILCEASHISQDPTSKLCVRRLHLTGTSCQDDDAITQGLHQVQKLDLCEKLLSPSLQRAPCFSALTSMWLFKVKLSGSDLVWLSQLPLLTVLTLEFNFGPTDQQLSWLNLANCAAQEVYLRQFDLPENIKEILFACCPRLQRCDFEIM